MNKRRFHVIKPNKATSRPRDVIFFDTETTPIPFDPKEDVHVLRLGWAAYCRRNDATHQYAPQWQPFTTQQEFWDFVQSHIHPEHKLYIVAHNVPFDWRIVGGFQHARENNWKLKAMYHKGQTALISYRVGKCTVQLLDSGNFFPVSLEKLGEMVGLEKLAVDFEACSEEELSTYCRRDVEILMKAWEAWLDFLDTHDLGNFKHTLPSQAFTAYRHRFMPYSINIHGLMEICLLEREAYHGGRTECFKVGEFPKGNYYQLDVNGMYAYLMMTQSYPYAMQSYRRHPKVELLVEKMTKFAVVARVDVETEYPVFTASKGNRIVYPVGRFQATLTTPELRFALEHGQIHDVKYLVWYAQAPIFRDYAAYFSGLKERYSEDGNAPFRSITKLFTNALYGKFGQKGLDIRINPEFSPMGRSYGQYYNNKTGVYGRTYPLGDDYVVEEQTAESYNSFPAIAAHVTAYARLYLWELVTLAGRDNTFYCDTDCLVVNQQGYDNLAHLLDDHKLGCLKVEATSEDLEIRASKDYRIGDKNRLKGIRENARELAPGVFEQDEFLGLSGAVACRKPDLVTVRKVTKILGREIKSGKVQESGWITPFRFPL